MPSAIAVRHCCTSRTSAVSSRRDQGASARGERRAAATSGAVCGCKHRPVQRQKASISRDGLVRGSTAVAMWPTTATVVAITAAPRMSRHKSLLAPARLGMSRPFLGRLHDVRLRANMPCSAAAHACSRPTLPRPSSSGNGASNGVTNSRSVRHGDLVLGTRPPRLAT